MKIVYVAGNYLPEIGGSEIVVHNLALLQQRLFGHEVTVLTRWPLWKYMRKRVPYRMIPFFPKTFSLVTDPKSPRWRFKVAASQIHLYQKWFSFDLWYLHTLYNHTFLTMSALGDLDIPTVLTCHGPDLLLDESRNYGQRMDPFINELVHKALPQFDRIIAISNSMKIELEKCGVQNESITLLPNGVDVQRIQETPDATTDLRNSLTIPSDHIIILTVGSNQPVKGFDLIPSIIKRLRDSRQDFTWILVGKNTHRLMTVAEEMGVSSSLRTLPVTTDEFANQGWQLPSSSLIQLYKLADIYVSTSRSEALPSVLLEAISAGLPVVATNATGLRDIVTPAIGLLAGIDDVDNLAASILQIMNSPDLANQFRKNALEESKRYSWPTIAALHNELYFTLLKQRAL